MIFVLSGDSISIRPLMVHAGHFMHYCGIDTAANGE
jgi:hypothetical protein